MTEGAKTECTKPSDDWFVFGHSRSMTERTLTLPFDGGKASKVDVGSLGFREPNVRNRMLDGRFVFKCLRSMTEGG